MSSFNNTTVIKIRNCQNGLHVTHRSSDNPDCILEHVFEKSEDVDLEYTVKVLWQLIDLLDLDYRVKHGEHPRHLEINVVDDSIDCD
jgi:hypothetical protein